jgi:hypothetical protein
MSRREIGNHYYDRVIGNMFDFALFLTLIVVIFSVIGIGCIGLRIYAVLGNKSPKSEIENDKNFGRRIID